MYYIMFDIITACLIIYYIMSDYHYSLSDHFYIMSDYYYSLSAHLLQTVWSFITVFLIIYYS